HSMHAVEMVETTDVAPGKVARVAAKGYKLHDRMIRAAMVYVAKAPQKAQEEKVPETAENQKESAKA
ncbi:MAG: nucleotide exchange factor GrpE, partial [Candidatus Enteromonas sp.]